MSGLALFRALKFLPMEGFFGAAECAQMRDVMSQSPSESAQVYSSATGATDENIRRTRAVIVSPEFRTTIVDRINSARDRAAEHFGISLSSTEGPQFLLYRAGDFFMRHTDKNDDGANARKVSFIGFINSDYEGGALKFFGGVDAKPLELTLPVSDGMLVFFRSDWLHEVEPVTRGERYTIAGWFA